MHNLVQMAASTLVEVCERIEPSPSTKMQKNGRWSRRRLMQAWGTHTMPTTLPGRRKKVPQTKLHSQHGLRGDHDVPPSATDACVPRVVVIALPFRAAYRCSHWSPGSLLLSLHYVADSSPFFFRPAVHQKQYRDGTSKIPCTSINE